MCVICVKTEYNTWHRSTTTYHKKMQMAASQEKAAQAVRKKNKSIDESNSPGKQKVSATNLGI